MWLLPDVFSFLFLPQIVGLRLKVSGCILSGVPTPAAPLVPEPYLKSLFVVLMSFGVFLLELIS